MTTTAKPHLDSQLVRAFRVGMELRREMVANGATRAEADKALEKILRANWPVPVLPEEQWPEKYRQPRCVRCDGYGLVMREVTNRLGLRVNEGTPCDCWAGDKFRPKPKAGATVAEAGKITPKPKGGWTRW